MTIKKDEAINKVMNDFEVLANLVLEQLDSLEEFFNSGEMIIPEDVVAKLIENEKHIDNLEVKLSDRIVNTIVLYQPVASEIRKIISCYRIITSLERIGDYAINLAEFMKSIKKQDVYEQLIDVISNMFFTASQMVKKSVISYTQQDRDLAIWTIKNDEAIDEMNQKMLKKVVSKSKNISESKKTLISFITIKEMVDNIERIADHATNIAEATFYFLDGKDIRHLDVPMET
ncbi:MAG: phosphate signaling complex protein PhoU [Prolixibacteraceae bacterium]|nr:phosphate signaling complex protein PhoU [Prolixibacteraceae bacterium]